MPLLTLVAATSFLCTNPTAVDGDEIRCADKGAAIKLYSIDAPRLNGECRPGHACAPGDPKAAHDRLSALVTGKVVKCQVLDPGRTGSRDMRCSADGIDLSCAMVDAGLALEREFPLYCDDLGSKMRISKLTTAPRAPIKVPVRWRWWIATWLIIANVVAYAAFAADKKRAKSGLNRVAEIHLLGLVLVGGGGGALLAQKRHDHMRDVQPFATQQAILIGLQLGTIVGLLGMLLWPASGA